MKLERPEKKTSRRDKRRHCSLALFALLALLGGALDAQQIEDEDLFNKSVEAAFEAVDFYGLSDDPVEVERINRIGYQIARKSGFTKFPFSFHLIDMAIPNAFALPAGHIFVTRGMLRLDLTDDMLAGLLGHEIAHVTDEHFLEMQRRATLLNVLSQVLTVGVLIGASQSDGDTYRARDPDYRYRRGNSSGDIVMGVAATGMMVTELLLRSYSRENEDEADEDGQRYAAAAGFDPDGTRQLMAKMESRLPQDQSFGYWQTHPFFEERVRAAKARKSTLTIKEPSSADDYRRATQKSLLEYVDKNRPPEKTVQMIKDTALAAWPSGAASETLRLENLHLLREAVAETDALLRDYGPVLEAYHDEIDTVVALTPDSPFLGTARDEIVEIREELAKIYPDASKVLEGEVYQTQFLASFLSNFPDSEEAPRVALLLGEAYSRLSREAEAVENFLRAWQADPEGDGGLRARRGLKSLTPYLERLAALQQLAEQEQDPDLSRVAAERLSTLVSTYEDLENGHNFLERFPDSAHAATVTQRQNRLADDLYKEIILYQRVGDHAKAVEGIDQILTWAPLSEAASELSESAVIDA